VEAVGKKVYRFKAGDKVVTLFNQRHFGGSLTSTIQPAGLGGVPDGCFRQYGSFNEEGLIKFPESLSFVEASTLPCAGVTAWNALFGLKGKALKPGDVVLTQGTGGVSTFAVQFAKIAGATVISTTSSSEKVEQLKKLGADHVINYKEDTNWGETAKKLTSDGEGVDFVIEVGGPTTMKQSLNAIKIDGIIAVIGFLGGFEGEQPSMLECLNNVCTVRGVFVGSRIEFGEMNAAIEAHKIKPLVDSKVFKLDQLKDAYQHMLDQKHMGKICVEME
jgi:NADPH:quinone reductase-like Zn-dependent oxidoreductase